MSKHTLYKEIGLQRDNKPHVMYTLVNKLLNLRALEL